MILIGLALISLAMSAPSEVQKRSFAIDWPKPIHWPRPSPTFPEPGKLPPLPAHQCVLESEMLLKLLHHTVLLCTTLTVSAVWFFYIDIYHQIRLIELKYYYLLQIVHVRLCKSNK